MTQLKGEEFILAHSFHCIWLAPKQKQPSVRAQAEASCTYDVQEAVGKCRIQEGGTNFQVCPSDLPYLLRASQLLCSHDPTSYQKAHLRLLESFGGHS